MNIHQDTPQIDRTENNPVIEKMAMTLTAESTEILPFLPYLLQDLWELGSSPDDMADLVLKHIKISSETKGLDLGCGKGAVSVRLAKKFGFKVKGIDLMPDFIKTAVEKAQENGVMTLCEFVVGDINEAVKQETNFDLVILGAVGDVLGGPGETLLKLKSTIKPGGHILIDDAYARQESDPNYRTRDEWMAAIRKSGLNLIDEKYMDDGVLSSINFEQLALITQRAYELQAAHPDKAGLFARYIKSQQDECNELENKLAGVTMLMKYAPN